MDELLAKLPDADSFRSVTILDAVRKELKTRGADSFFNARLLLSAVQRRLSNARNPASEDVVTGALGVLGDFVGCMDAELLAGVPAVFADAVPLLAKDRPRRAAAALIAGLSRRAPTVAQRMAEPLVARGLRSENVRRR